MRALVFVMLLAGVARAGDQAKAEAYFNAGQQAFDQQSFPAAAEQFELAYKEAPLPEIAFSAAQSYRRAFYVDAKPEYAKRAAELYRVYLDKVKNGGRVGDAADGLAEVERALDRFAAAGTKIGDISHDATRIAVSVSVAGEKHGSITEVSARPATSDTHATATLDGKPMDLFTPIAVPAGEHTVAVTAPGYEPASQTHHVIEGATELVAIELVPKQAHVKIDTEDGARVTLNGRAGATQDVPAGTYLVTVTRRGREPIEREITVGRDETKSVSLPMTFTPRRRALPWLLIGAGTLAVGATTFGLIANHYDGTMSSLDAQRTSTGITVDQLAQYRSAVSDRDATRDIAYITGGAALAVGLTAAALWYFDVPMPAEHVVPTVTPNGAGIAGRF